MTLFTITAFLFGGMQKDPIVWNYKKTKTKTKQKKKKPKSKKPETELSTTKRLDW